jgi:polyhydroxybutyrate depolymerase
MMTFRIACELSGKIAAAAPYAGALNTDMCAASSPVPILIMNGEDDANVPVAGGDSPNIGFRGEDDRIDNPTSFAVATWVTLNGCVPSPVVEKTFDQTTSTYATCANGATVEQVLIHGWPHSWPDPADGSPIDGSQVIWDFVSQFSKPAV